MEAEISALLDQIVPRDFPFLGACYGIGTLGTHEGAVVDRTYSEPLGATMISLTEPGRADRLFQALPPIGSRRSSGTRRQSPSFRRTP